MSLLYPSSYNITSHRPTTHCTAGLNPQDLITQEEIEAAKLAAASEVERDHALVHGGYDVKLTDDNAFYSVLRRRVTTYLRKNGGPGPTYECMTLFWCSWFAWVICWWHMYFSGSVAAAVVVGLLGGLLGGFGHNWVHQPRYRHLALISLDPIGYSSEGWFREHLLQHHMYTNTPLDNHFHGTDPWLVTDPNAKRHWTQRVLTPYIAPLFFSVGMWANFCAHGYGLLTGNEVGGHWDCGDSSPLVCSALLGLKLTKRNQTKPNQHPQHFSIGKLFVPVEVFLLLHGWGWRGLLLCYLSFGITSVWYFSLALMNHNAEVRMEEGKAEREKRREE